MRLLLPLLLLVPTMLHAEQLPLERLFQDPALTGPRPLKLAVAPDGARVTFLRGKADDQNRLDLWEYHVASGQTRLLVDSALLAPGPEQLSDEEKARRERQRIAALSGIVGYQFSPDGKQLLFPLNGELYLYDLRKSGSEAVRQLTHGEGFVTDPKVSPRGGYVSFVREQNLWVIELATGRTMAVTIKGGGTVACGVAEFVAQEEMNRYTGYWWAPDDSALAYTCYDESGVPIHRRFELYADRTEVIEQRYPAAGEANVRIALEVATLVDVKVAATEAKSARPAQVVPLGEDPDIYLVRVNWLPDGKRLAFQRMARNQRRLDLVLHDTRDGAQRTLLTETSDTWINLNDDLRFLKSREAFIWGSERSGLAQLYLYSLDGTLLHPITTTPWAIDGVLALDSKRGLVYSGAPGPDPKQRHVYAYPLDGDGEPRRITREDGTHTVVFSDDARVFVDTYTSRERLPTVSLRRSDGRVLTVLEANELKEGHPYWPYHANHRAQEFGTIKASDGQTLHFQVTKPPGFDPTKRHPVLVFYYGGPHGQVVTDTYDLDFTQWMAQRGYVVFSLDNRGMARRGKAFEDPIFRQMGKVEIEDQLAGIAWLKQQPWVDPARIGAYGWSYGGYMTLMLLAKASDQIAAGAAVAPVADWRLYDTFYTERYLDHPKDNAEGYRLSGVLPWLEGLKSPLLLAHGMADDNVLFVNSTAVMSALQAQGTPFELMTYPGAKHGISGPANQTHVFRTMADFFDRHLKPGE